jgi:hypothetical protein
METTTHCRKEGKSVANTLYLEEEIKKSGLKKAYLAKLCGMTRQSFTSKCKDPSSFTAAQVSILCKELKITQVTRQRQIFFA